MAGIIEDYLAQVRAALPMQGRPRARILCEIEEHLLEAQMHACESGIPAEEALKTALARFGPPEMIAQGFVALDAARQARRLRWGLLAGTLLCLGVVIYCLVRYPSILSPLAESLIFLVLFAGGIAVYGVAALWGTRLARPSAALVRQLGTRWGLLFGVLWILEILVGNLNLAFPWLLPVYYGAIFGVLSLTIVAGALGAHRTGTLQAGANIGFWSGLISGVIAFLTLMFLTIGFPGIVLHDPQNIQQFHRSDAPDLMTFIVGDALAGGIMHLLIIGPLLGMVLGTVGGIIGQGLPPHPSSSQPAAPA